MLSRFRYDADDRAQQVQHHVEHPRPVLVDHHDRRHRLRRHHAANVGGKMIAATLGTIGVLSVGVVAGLILHWLTPRSLE
jgi:hypothetical protein